MDALSSDALALMKREQKRKIVDKLTSMSFLIPIVILFGTFVVFPIIQSLIIGFQKWDGLGPKEWVGFDNYIKLFDDQKFYIALKNNLVWLVLMLFAPVFALFISLFLNQSVKGMKFVKSMFFFPFVINLVVVGLVFSWFYNPDFGILAEIFRMVGLTPLPILADENMATYGIIIAALWPQTAYCMIVYLTGLTNIDPQVIEAGKIDGAKGSSMFWNVVLPQIRPATFTCVVITVIGALRNFDLIAIMTAGGPWGSSNVLSYFMYEESIFNFKMGYGAAIASVLFFIMNIIIYLFLRRTLQQDKE